ncbi:MAG: c-type cytochrome [Planctomycetaceae bacterium]|nr:c-type cytochrome [Planctomycetaceae bacterium]
MRFPAQFFPRSARVILLGLTLPFLSQVSLHAAEPAPLKLPPGFEATIYASHDLAGSVQAMTVNSRGEILVSAPGYIRTLIDENADGVADRFQDFTTDLPAGVQGMCCDGPHVYCVGGEGILRYTDENQDGIADGPPELMFRCRTGGEHYTHAIRKGPDGWWYVIAGNETNLDFTSLNEESSPVRKPSAGVLMRFPPDFQQMEVLSDGLRNAYDFDWNVSGDPFVYDSDGERDISLPWYRPTRLFHSLPGMTHGWVSRSWKAPHYFLDMTPTLVEAGRGSPTGVVCYRHHQFPEEFYDATFILDWTYGRVIAIKTQPQGATWAAQARNFATGVGSYGFAPTDAAVGPDGALYISVGGRGTQGSVFRITYQTPATSAEALSTDPLEQILNSAQPLEAWSRKQWERQARETGEEAILKAALDESRSVAQRRRAIEVLTEIFEGPDFDFMKEIHRDPSAQLRARAVWAYGRSTSSKPDPVTLQPFLVDPDPQVIRSGLEALLSCPAESLVGYENEIANALSHEDHFIQFLAVRVASRMADAGFRQVGESARKAGWNEAMLMAYAFVDRGYVGHKYAWHDVGAAALSKLQDPHERLTAVLLIQHALGGFGDSPVHSAVFDGYLPRLPLDQPEDLLADLRSVVEEIYPTGNQRLDWELARLIAMTSLDSLPLLDRLTQQLTESSDPVSDIHHLIVLSTVPTKRSPEQTQAAATALLSLHQKLQTAKAEVDRNWEPRVKEMYQKLVEHDAELPRVIVNHKQFGRPEHNMFVDAMQPDDRTRAIAIFLEGVEEKQVQLTPDLLRLIGELPADRVLDLARKSAHDPLLNTAAIPILAAANQPQDHELIREALRDPFDSSQDVYLQAVSQWDEYSLDDLISLYPLLERLSREEKQEKLWEKSLRVFGEVARSLVTNVPEVDVPADLISAIDLNRSDVVEGWSEWIDHNFPEVSLHGNAADPNTTTVDWRAQLQQVDWTAGDTHHGEQLFQTLKCALCHNGHIAVGPNLSGVTSRFSRDNLFEAIYDPHRDVSSRYRTEAISTDAGKTFTGIVIYESVDGLLLRDTSHQTVRIEASQIEFRKPLTLSLMPANLLNDSTPQDLADLYAYLQTLSGASTF